MSEIVQFLQMLSGALWLLPALYLTPRIIGAWKADATRGTMLAAPIAFLCWLMAGFTVRWLIWPHAMGAMSAPELTTWAALYALSAGLAGWFLAGAIQTRGE